MIDGAAVASRISEVLVALHYYLCSRLGSRAARARGPLVPRWQQRPKKSPRMAEHKEQKLPDRVNHPSCPMLTQPPGWWLARRVRSLRRRIKRVAREPHEGPHFRFKPAITRKLGYFRLRRLLVVCERRERPSKLPVAASRQLSATRRLSARE